MVFGKSSFFNRDRRSSRASSVQSDDPEKEQIVTSLSFHNGTDVSDEKPEQQPNNCFYSSICTGLGLSALLIASAIDTLTFYTGLKDIPDKLLGVIPITPLGNKLLAGLYALQSATLNKEYTMDGISEIYHVIKGEKTAEWEELSCAEAYKANLAAFVVDFIALSFDAMMIAYYLEQQDLGLDNITSLIVGIVTSLVNIPEPYETYKFMRSYFSKKQTTVNAALKEIHQSDFYTETSFQFKKEFDQVLDELSIPVKNALLEEKNAHLVTKDGKALKEKLLEIFKLQNHEETKDQLIAFGIDETIAIQFALKLSALALQQVNEKPEKTYRVVTQKTVSGVNWALKNTIKLAGALEDMTECFTTMSVISERLLNNSSQELHIAILVLSTANAITDIMFNGKIAGEGIDAFEDALLTGNYGPKEVILFLSALCCAAIVGHAQLSLILSMLYDPDAVLPFPLPPRLPDGINMALGYGAGLRELILYTSYFYSAFEMLYNIPSRVSHMICSSPPHPLEEKLMDPNQRLTGHIGGMFHHSSKATHKAPDASAQKSFHNKLSGSR